MSIISDTKELITLAQKAGMMDVYQKLVDLQGQIVELSSERLELAEKNDTLEKVLNLKSTLVFSDQLYWAKDDNVPFCPCCFDDKSKAIHLYSANGVARYGEGDIQIFYDCKSCQSNYQLNRQSEFVKDYIENGGHVEA